MEKGENKEIEIKEFREQTVLWSNERGFRITRDGAANYVIDGTHIHFKGWLRLDKAFASYDDAHNYVVDFIYNHSK